MSETWREGFARIDESPGLTHSGNYAAEQSYMRSKLDEYEAELKKLEKENRLLKDEVARLHSMIHGALIQLQRR